EPDVDNADITRGRVRHVKDPRPVVAQWRARAEAEGLSIRDLVAAARCASSTPGDVDATIGIAWCSATQNRR
ncbi:hypothetical protein, partial [Cellulomonas septica]|uniref:hypothetical protein n=1 Tax=Cellulomonas septica TaxID=285080 RepID=UPI001FEAD400